MNALMSIGQQALTMTSREIAELTGKRHDNVMRTIKALQDRGLIAAKEEWASLGDQPGPKAGVQYRLEKRDTYVVVAQLSPAHIGCVVDAWGRTQASLQELIDALEAFDIPPEAGDLFLYAIREVESGRIKLGISRNPMERLAQLQTGNSQRLEIVAVSNAGRGFLDESGLHQAAASYRIRGEWFRPEALEFMK